MNQTNPSHQLSASSPGAHLTSTDLERAYRRSPGEASSATEPAFLRCHSDDCFVATNEFDTAPAVRSDGDSVILGA